MVSTLQPGQVDSVLTGKEGFGRMDVWGPCKQLCVVSHLSVSKKHVFVCVVCVVCCVVFAWTVEAIPRCSCPAKVQRFVVAV